MSDHFRSRPKQKCAVYGCPKRGHASYAQGAWVCAYHRDQLRSQVPVLVCPACIAHPSTHEGCQVHGCACFGMGCRAAEEADAKQAERLVGKIQVKPVLRVVKVEPLHEETS